MTERPRFFDDLAGVAGGALSALAGVREEAEAVMRARMDEAIRKFDLVRREDLEAVQDMAANARAGQEAADARLALLEARLSALEGQGNDARGSSAGAPASAPGAGASEADPASMPPKMHLHGDVPPNPSEVTPAALPPHAGEEPLAT